MTLSIAEALLTFISLSKAFRELSELITLARSEDRDISLGELEAIQAKYELSNDMLDDAIKRAEEREVNAK
jgi:hypothetical protein